MTATAAAAPAGLPPLRPMTTADVLDGGFRLLRAAPVAVGVPALVVAVLVTLAQTGLRLLLTPDADTFVGAGTAFGVAALLQLGALLLGVVGAAVVAAFLAGVVVNGLADRPLTLAAVWPVVRGRLPAVIGVAVVVGVVQTVALAFLIVPGVWLWVLWSLAAPAVVFERASVGRALGRSRTLVRGSFWRLFGLRLLAALVTLALGYLFQVPFGLLSELVDSPTYATSLAALGTLLATAVVLPVRAAVDLMLYLDQRVRREAFDVVVALGRTAR